MSRTPLCPWGQTQDLDSVYSIFLKVEKDFGRHCVLHSTRCSRTLASRSKQTSPAVPLGFVADGWKRKERSHVGREKWNRDGWGRWGLGVGPGWGRDWAVVAVPRGGEVDYLSTSGNMRLGNLFL